MASKQASERTLRERVLLFLAERLGPELDVVDPLDQPGVEVRDVVIEFVDGKDACATPTEVRGALLELIEAEHVRIVTTGRDVVILDGETQVGLLVRGLLAARELEPGCGSPRVVTLEARAKGRALGVKLRTGDPDLDRTLGRNRTALACLFVLSLRQPTMERPLVIAECATWFERLAVVGIGPVTGPGDRLNPSAEAIGNGLAALEPIVPVKRKSDADDQRLVEWYLAGPMPEILLRPGSRRHFQDWPTMRRALHCIVYDEPFPRHGWDELIYGQTTEVSEAKRKARVANRTAAMLQQRASEQPGSTSAS